MSDRELDWSDPAAAALFVGELYREILDDPECVLNLIQLGAAMALRHPEWGVAAVRANRVSVEGQERLVDLAVKALALGPRRAVPA